MQLRLAFAVAAFLENEILVIDEVLAVGDAEFQKKCMGKMEDVSKSGRTILFVSHQLGAISNLCSKSILLNNGTLSMTDETTKVIEHYLLSIQNSSSNIFVAKPKIWKGLRCIFQKFIRPIIKAKIYPILVLMKILTSLLK